LDPVKDSNRPHTEVILDSIADGVFTVDMDWNLTSFNRAAERITGVSRKEAIGQKCFDVFRGDICQSACALRHSMETGEELVDQRVNILNSRGHKVQVSISTAVLRDPTGGIVGGVETFRDLTAIEALRDEVRGRYSFEDMVSKNHEVQRIFGILPDIAASDSTLLIEGPSGSGKELVARAVHNQSERRKKRLVVINCGALPDTLLESELFGYVRGAFTDAKRDKPGRFALAEGGTIFLDEVGEISTALQVKLLRVLQEREYEPLGGTTPMKSNVRVIAATNQTLSALVARGVFRDDLYYRLNVVRVVLPPLSRRREDIPLLIDHFLGRFRAKTGKSIEAVSADVLTVLMRHTFPGNIRELENIIEHAFILCHQRTIELEHLPVELLKPAQAASGSEPGRGQSPVDAARAAAIQEVLARHGGNRRKTAAELGVHSTTLWRWMRRMGIQYPSNRHPD